MDVAEAVRTILAIREYAKKPIPAELVERIGYPPHPAGKGKKQRKPREEVLSWDRFLRPTV